VHRTCLNLNVVVANKVVGAPGSISRSRHQQSLVKCGIA